MRGRKAEPAAVKEAKGNPGRRPIAETGELEPANVRLAAPAQLQGLAREIWAKTAPELAQMRLLRSTDHNAFAAYCQTAAEYWQATGHLRRRARVYETKSKHVGRLLRINPWFMVQQRLLKSMIDLEDRFGLTPAARQRILAGLALTPPELPLDQPSEERAPAPVESPLGFLKPQGSA